MKKSMTYKQNIRGAMIFLNTFGLFLEELENLTEDSVINIYDENGQKVGNVSFRDDDVVINAITNFGKLEASYNCAEMSGFIDYENNSIGELSISNSDKIFSFIDLVNSNPMFIEWCNDISYSIKIDDSRRITGQFLISCSVDSEYGIKCTCHPTLEYWENDKRSIVIGLQNNGNNFKAQIFNKDDSETICVSPYADFGEYILHRVIKGTYDSKKYGYPYRKMSGVTVKSHSERNILKVLSIEEEYDNLISHKSSECAKVCEDDQNEEAIIQRGMIMQEIDSTMYDSIKKLRTFFTFNEVPFLDNLICVSLQNFSSKEINALFGIEEIEMNFQNNTNNLCDAYYGKTKKNINKKLLKNNTE